MPSRTSNHTALYLRSSKDRSDVSIDAQRRELTALATQRGLLVVREYSDVVESGTDENRPGLRALVAGFIAYGFALAFSIPGGAWLPIIRAAPMSSSTVRRAAARLR